MIELDDKSAELFGLIASDFYSSVKGVYLMIGMAAMLIAGISAVFLMKKITKETDWRYKAYLISGGAFILFTLISAFMADNIIVSFGGLTEQGEGFFTILAYIAAFLYTMLMFEKTKDFRCIAITLMVVIGLNLIVGISQYAGHDILKNTAFGNFLIIPSKYDYLADGLTTHLARERMYGTLGHYNHMGTFAAMMAPLFTTLAVTAKDMKTRIAMAVTAAGSAVLLFGSTARGGLVGFAAAVIIAVILFSRQLISHWKITLSVVGAGVILAVGLNLLTGGKIFSRVSYMIEDLFYIKNSETAEDYMSTLPVQNIQNLEDGTVIITAGEKELTLSFNKEDKFTISDGSESMALKDGSEFAGFSFVYKHADAKPERPQDGDLDMLILHYEKQPMFHFRGTDKGAHLVSPYSLENIEMQFPPVADYFKGKEKIGSMRGYIWGRTIPLMKETLFFGYGPDNFAFHFPQYDFLGKYYAYGTTNMIISRPHNIYLQTFVNNGGLAFLMFIAIVLLYAVDCFRLYCFKKIYRGAGAGNRLVLSGCRLYGGGTFQRLAEIYINRVLDFARRRRGCKCVLP